MQNVRRKYDGETSEGVPFSFTCSSLVVRSHLVVKIVAPQVPDSQTPEIIIKYKN